VRTLPGSHGDTIRHPKEPSRRFCAAGIKERIDSFKGLLGDLQHCGTSASGHAFNNDVRR
jgi:hypothetical protein